MSRLIRDTIAAIATPPGKGGVGILRLSGPAALSIGASIVRFDRSQAVKSRHAYYRDFYDQAGVVLDQGIFLYFQAPHSFTGEDVVEVQAHGGPIVLDLILKAVIAHGARLAGPGEFSERAFLNGKIDLLQAEAIADLINASSDYAARCAVRTLSGGFSTEINQMLDGLIKSRVFVEAALDFPEEEIPLLSIEKLIDSLAELSNACLSCLGRAKQGATIKNGLRLLILGEPNVGKSSLMNLLFDDERAIVTDVPGTTRDIISEQIIVDGVPIQLVDTAGIRHTSDEVEKVGIHKAKKEIAHADHIFLMVDARDFIESELKKLKDDWIQDWSLNEVDWSWDKVTVLVNKIDLGSQQSRLIESAGVTGLYISIKEQVGIDLLKKRIKTISGLTDVESPYIARRRHLDALERTHQCVQSAIVALKQGGMLDLAAEDLKEAQKQLSLVTGKFSSDDLLGEIFSNFCIGK